MNTPDRDFCFRAIAYVKATLPIDDAPAMTLDLANSPVMKKVAPSLAAAYIVDTGNSFTYIQHRHLSAAGITSEELHSKAIYNLAAMAQTKVKVQPYGNIYAVLMGGNFEASLVLFDGFWVQSCAHLAPNGFIAALPARDILAFTDAANAQGIEELHQLCARVGSTNDHPLTTQLYSYVSGVWQPYG
ncbi:DUF1444 family protein [Dyella psychrodurans]|uniref:DUF1444 family protein n=1 Tax=Dyella psychrodurans TaxID=1927960 RepID=A0A370WZA4_9GAMM|nr:DUF1444 family protein [Dyella psychrodurans]RDS81351.1 DUF1444 family protein [Dyella psychrodurans]